MEDVAVDKQPLTLRQNRLLALHPKGHGARSDQAELKFPVPMPADKAENVPAQDGFIDRHGKIKGAVGGGFLPGAVDENIINLHKSLRMGWNIYSYIIIEILAESKE